MNRSWLAAWVVGVSTAIWAALSGAALHGAEAPPATRPATRPAQASPRQPSAPAPQTEVVKRGRLNLVVEAESAFQPLDAFELVLKPRAYGGPLTVVRAAAPRATVRKGDVLLKLDATQIDWDLRQAEAAAASARSAFEKAQADLELGAAADALQLRMTEEHVKNSEAALKWFDDVEGPAMLKQQELAVKQWRDSIEDQTDELDQLRKMYKSEELTSATADIVMKRAERRLAQSREQLALVERNREKVVAHDHPVARQRYANAVEQARQQLKGLRAAQAASAVTRRTAVESAKVALEQAEKRLADLKADRAMFEVVSPADGVVLYGSQRDQAWQGGDPRALAAGEKVSAGATLMRVYAPGRLRVEVGLSEPQAFWVKAGMPTRASAAALPHVTMRSTCGDPAPAPRGGGSTFGFETIVDLPDADPRLLPGMKAIVRIEPPPDEGGGEVLLIPARAVREGKVSVIDAAGETRERPVQLGRTDGAHVEVKEGLAEGERVVVPGGKP